MQRFLSLLILFSNYILLQAQTDDDDELLRKYSNDYLSIGIGAKALAMGNSVVASTGDVTSGYWNPAGLVRIQNNFEAGLMHAEYFAGMAKFDYFGASYKLDSLSTAGLSIIRYGVDDIQNTLELFDSDGNIDYDRITKFSVADYAFLFSYARKSRIQGLKYGANIKIIYRDLGEFAKAYGFGLDAGLQYDKGKWHLGVSAKDITTTFNAWRFNEEAFEESTYEFTEIPDNAVELTAPTVILAFARNFTLTEKFGLLAECNGNFTFDGQRSVLVSGDPVSIDPHLGLELDYKKLVYLRLGVSNIQEVEEFDDATEWSVQPNLGLGVHLFNFMVDYALTDIGDRSVSLYSNVFSLRYSFDYFHKR